MLRMKFLACLKKCKECVFAFVQIQPIALDRRKEKMYNLVMLQM